MTASVATHASMVTRMVIVVVIHSKRNEEYRD